MATDWKVFDKKIATGIKYDGTRFLFTYKYENKIRRKIVDYSDKAWTFPTEKKQAQADYVEFQKSVRSQISGDLTEYTKLDEVATLWFDLVANKTKWHTALHKTYDIYLRQDLGNLAIGRITQTRVDTLKKKMATTNFNDDKRTKNGVSPRTIEKVIKQLLIPLLRYAEKNGAKVVIPDFKTEKGKKKVIKDAPDKFIRLYSAIITRYADVPYYRAMFLFALYGRRLNEILTLEASDIDFENMTYHIREEISKIDEGITFSLPPLLATALMELDVKKGLVFESPKTGEKAWSPSKQLAKLREDANIPELTMHLFRHILASAIIQGKGDISMASTILGHKDIKTTIAHYATTDHKKSSLKTNEMLGEVIDIK